MVKAEPRHVATYLDGRNGGEGTVEYRPQRVAEGCGPQMMAEGCGPLMEVEGCGLEQTIGCVDPERKVV